ncbi:1-phosphofructokinase family hexose kinase [Dactylosporangium sp. CA-139066]|uniref:1-phosphofructokinase family hexose kinase n=1 Tax=Dactylosporangium sp. CA-139066 TaxID=3239930 RepID=UPI003D91E862
MILTVTLNPALDLTYDVDELRPHATHRVRAVHERPGGKGLNVARVLHAQGSPVLATGFLGGPVGASVQALVDAAGLPSAFVPIASSTRRTVTVADAADATGLWEPGPVVTAPEWSAFLSRYGALLADASVVALSGSLPRGLPPSSYATLIRLARARGIPTVLDTSGDALRLALPAHPDVIKPNAAELAEIGHVRINALKTLTSGAVVVSRGALGLLAVTPAGSWRAAPPAALAGNPTGAGDACVAALARGLRDRTPWPELLADAVALSAAAVAAPVAGAVDEAVYRRLRPLIAVEQHDPAALDPTADLARDAVGVEEHDDAAAGR